MAAGMEVVAEQGNNSSVAQMATEIIDYVTKWYHFLWNYVQDLFYGIMNVEFLMILNLNCNQPSCSDSPW